MTSLPNWISLTASVAIGALALAAPLPAQSAADSPGTVWETGPFTEKEMHGLAIEREGKSKAEVVAGRLRISGEDQYSKLTVYKELKGEPYPDDVRFTLAPVGGAIEGRIVIRIINPVTGASISVLRASDEDYAWTFSEDARWNDWKRYVKVPAPVSADGRISIRITKTAVDTFKIFVNDTPASGDIKNPALKTIARVSLTSEFKTAFDLISIKTVTVPGIPRASAADDVRITTLPLPPANVRPVPTNANANGYQIAYFERGFSDGMTDPARRAEFVSCLRSLNPGALRFPGGTWAYWYSDISPKSIAAFAKLDKAPYFVKSSEFRWSNDDYFLGICKELGVTAIYQLNIGTWYDEKTDRAYKLVPFDRRLKDGLSAEQVMQSRQGVGAIDTLPEMKDVDTSFMKEATAHAAQLARKAKDLGVNVVWEFGNEDYVNFKPATYVRQSRAFYEAIRAVTPDARFAFCADGDSWSDHQWDTAVYAELVKNGMSDMEEASTHMYLTGGGGGPRDNGADLYKATRAAWSALRHMHNGWRTRLADAGLNQAKLSLTEYNALHLIKNVTGTALEHSMGRALGEASIWPDLITRFNYVVFHDLVRNGYGHGTWFARMHYMPDNPPGYRYVLPLDGKVMSIMHRHAAGRIIYSDENVVVSQGRDSLLVSIGNERAIGLTHEIRLTGDTAVNPGRQTKTLGWKTLAVPDLGTSEHIAFESPGTTDGSTLSVKVPAFSFSYVIIPLR